MVTVSKLSNHTYSTGSIWLKIKHVNSDRSRSSVVKHYNQYTLPTDNCEETWS